MAIVELQKLSVCASKTHRKEILETLQEMGVMEVLTEGIGADELATMDTDNARGNFLRRSELMTRAMQAIEEARPDDKKGLSLFAGKTEVTREHFEKVVDQREATIAKAQTVVGKQKAIADCKAEILRNENRIEQLLPWQALDCEMECKGTKTTRAFLGTLPGLLTEAEVLAMAGEDLDGAPLSVEVLSAQGDATYISLLCMNEQADAVTDNLRRHGFARPVQVEAGVPAETIAQLKKEISEKETRIQTLTEEIAAYAKERENFEITADYYRTRAEKYRMLGLIPQTESALFFEGWVPKRDAEAVRRLLSEQFDAVVEVEDAGDEVPPTLLRNNAFSESAEGVLESYGLPTRGHVDPTFIMSFFYVIFFGMMFSDAGYGIVMAIACGVVWLWKKEKLSESMKKMVKLFFFCGLSTTFWGFMFGSFFGDAIDVVAKTFFHYAGETPILKPLWFEPLGNPMRLLVWCMFFGLIHLFFGLGIKGYEYLKEKDVVGFVSDILSWYLFIIGLILLLLPSDLFGSIAGDSFDFSGMTRFSLLGKVLTIAGLALILLMQERSQKNWVLRILLGLYDVYGVSGWLSDVLSYSRLLALGLATGVIAQVVNMMGSMMGGGVIGAIIFVVVFLFGHALNFAINVLGAYVHTNRLQFVEFFGKFYEGGGETFEAFRTAHQYTTIKEEKRQ